MRVYRFWIWMRGTSSSESPWVFLHHEKIQIGTGMLKHILLCTRSILNEVGRVDQLADLPIDVGVPDDGLLVGKSMEGNVGLILCSFLEPLR